MFYKVQIDLEVPNGMGHINGSYAGIFFEDIYFGQFLMFFDGMDAKI